MAKGEWSPFHRALRAHGQVARILGDLMDPFRPVQVPMEAQWEPATDVCETPEAIIVHMEIAGVDPHDIDIEYDPHSRYLVVTGYRAPAGTAEEGRCHLVEIEAGRFLRRVSIPVPVDQDQIRAVGKHGLLRVVLPKRPQQRRRVEIGVE